MSMTDELRLLLNERGVKWSADDILSDCYTEWSTDKHTCSALELNGRLVYSVGNVSVTEVIEATLGRGECQECHATEQNYKHCKYSTNRGWCDDECDLPETRIDHGSIEYNGTTEWRRCSVCGAEVLAYPAKFCPNCGRQAKR